MANRLFGSDGNDVLEGRGGADVLDGGEGIDTATYAASATSVWVDLLRVVQSGGEAEGDRLSAIETVLGSRYDDTLLGDAG